MLALGLVVVGGYLVARWTGNKVLFPRTRIESYDSVKFPLQFKNGVSYIYDRPEAETVVIFSHGNGGDLTSREKIRELFDGTEYGLINYDYYGYGASQDVPTLLMNETALTKAIEEMAELTKGKKVILLGASMGCFPTCWLASRKPKNLLGVILCVPFDSLASYSIFVPFFLGSYDNLALCHKIQVPTLVVQATQDRVIPEEAAQRLAGALGDWGSLMTVPTGHQGYLTEPLKKRILSFIRDLVRKS